MNYEWISERGDTLQHALNRVVERAPDRVLFDFSGELTTYGEFERKITRFAHVLAGMGLTSGATLVSMLDNSLDAMVTWFAVNRLGAIWVPLNTALKGEFLRHQIADSSASIMVCESAYLDRVEAIADQLQNKLTVLVRGEMPASSKLTTLPLNDYRGDDDTPLPIVATPDAISCIIYTSGTTGPSKGAMQPYNFFCNLARARLSSCPASEEDITFTPMPLFHNNALATGVAGTIISGGRIVIAPRFSVSAFWSEVRRSGATIVSIVGTMASFLADAEVTEDEIACRGQVHTVRGVPFSDRVKQVWRERFGCRYVGSNDYGMTEAAVVTWLKGGEWAPPNSSGKRFADFDVRIFDENDCEVPVGESGEIVIRAMKPNIMFKGYWRRPEATAEVMRNQWFHTGDVGRFDEHGFLYFVDRKKDYLKRRGENISSFEMEVAIKAHPAILDVAVHAVPSPHSHADDDVKVTAILKDGQSVDHAEFCAWIAERVPHFAIPRYIEFRDALPRNPQDKVLKYQLRNEGVTPATWDREAAEGGKQARR